MDQGSDKWSKFNQIMLAIITQKGRSVDNLVLTHMPSALEADIVREVERILVYSMLTSYMTGPLVPCSTHISR